MDKLPDLQLVKQVDAEETSTTIDIKEDKNNLWWLLGLNRTMKNIYGGTTKGTTKTNRRQAKNKVAKQSRKRNRRR